MFNTAFNKLCSIPCMLKVRISSSSKRKMKPIKITFGVNISKSDVLRGFEVILNL